MNCFMSFLVMDSVWQIGKTVLSWNHDDSLDLKFQWWIESVNKKFIIFLLTRDIFYFNENGKDSWKLFVYTIYVE